MLAKVLDHSVLIASWPSSIWISLPNLCQNAGQSTVGSKLAAYCVSFQCMSKQRMDQRFFDRRMASSKDCLTGQSPGIGHDASHLYAGGSRMCIKQDQAVSLGGTLMTGENRITCSPDPWQGFNSMWRPAGQGISLLNFAKSRAVYPNVETLYDAVLQW